MGCCASTPAAENSPYPTAQASSSSRAINTQPGSHSALPRPSTVHTNASSQHTAPRTQRSLAEPVTRPLRRHVWVSKKRAWTKRDIDRERVAFFDTRVTGREEIWQAIRTALELLWAEGDDGGESDDGSVATAQTVLEAAGITIPTGNLRDGVYDAFGAYYKLDDWVVSYPTNMVQVDGEDKDVGDESEGAVDEEEAIRRREEKGKAVISEADMIRVKARLSDSGDDVVVKVGKDDSVRQLTKRVFEESGLDPQTGKKIKIVYLGKVLDENMPLIAQGWKADHIVSALVFGGV